MWRKLGDFRAAADDYGRVVVAGQGTVRLYNNYAFCLAKLGLYDEAVAAYDSALQLDPYNAHALHNRSVARSVHPTTRARGKFMSYSLPSWCS